MEASAFFGTEPHPFAGVTTLFYELSLPPMVARCMATMLELAVFFDVVCS